MTRLQSRLGGRLALSAATCAVAVLSAAVPAAASPAPPGRGGLRLTLPEPSGPYRVGEVALHLADASRPDPWQPGQARRELMVSVFYPAGPADRPAQPRDAAPYMLPTAAAHFDAVTVDDYLHLGVPAGRADWARTATHVRRAPGATGRHPVVLYSPGLGEPRTWGTTLVADLASRGYAVVTIDHTYESPEVQFPDGRLATLSLPDDPGAFIDKALAVRVADTAFVLDQLAGIDAGADPDVDGQPLPDGLAGALDLARVGMFGHSMGGTAAALAMDADRRIAAGVDLDGNLTDYAGTPLPVARHGLDRPFLLLGKDGPTDTGPGWQAFLANTPGWKRQLTLRGSEHASFTDAEALIPQLGLDRATRVGDIGTIEPVDAVRTTEAYLAAYFDRWLRDGCGRLLDGPSPRYPAMEFVG
ncbi:lipase [Kitasatospora paracochleata]|uniref:Dienelactone hydrolase n=1 Tax=Kitasatospora paracochleata TaxID=58354 RepID=A0ABT1J2C9_9ACTN|nr:Tat pathway signal protein [Kitasatospora paracochleata]MCP2311293.1 dienelactone hydrolase [Kitasatospora paracochleata]